MTIEPCPYCGEEATLEKLTYPASPTYYVSCSGCNASGPLQERKEDAAGSWNFVSFMVYGAARTETTP